MKSIFVAVIIIGQLLASLNVKAEEVAEVTAKGLVFKDKIKVVAFDDPTIAGITCYTTYYDRALTFENSGDSSLSCRQTGRISGDLKSMSGIFSQNKNLFFKTTVVDRFYDSKRNVMIYLSYTTATSGKNAGHSVSVVPIQNNW